MVYIHLSLSIYIYTMDKFPTFLDVCTSGVVSFWSFEWSLYCPNSFDCFWFLNEFAIVTSAHRIVENLSASPDTRVRRHEFEVWTQIHVVISTVGRVFPDIAALAPALLSGCQDLVIAYIWPLEHENCHCLATAAEALQNEDSGGAL